MKERNETLEWLKSITPYANRLKAERSKGVLVDLHLDYIPKGMQLAIEHDDGTTMLINDVLEPLISILYSYKDSHGFNYVPGTNEDTKAGWDYFERKFNEVYAGLNKNIYIGWHLYIKVLKIIREMQYFVRSFSGASGVADRYFKTNPNLKYYRMAFELRESDEESYNFAAENNLLDYVPTEAEFEDRKDYLKWTLEMTDDYNFGYTTDDYFIHELVYALRLQFHKCVAIEQLR